MRTCRRRFLKTCLEKRVAKILQAKIVQPSRAQKVIHIESSAFTRWRIASGERLHPTPFRAASSFRPLAVSVVLAGSALWSAVGGSSAFGTASSYATRDDSQQEHHLEVVAPSITDGVRATLLEAARAILLEEKALSIDDDGPSGSRWLLISLGRQSSTALVAQGKGDSLDSALREAARSLRRRARPAEIEQGPLKIDVAVETSSPEAFDEEGRASIDRSLEGLWLPGPELLLLPEELLSRRLVNSDGDVQSRRLRSYLEEGARARLELPRSPGRSGASYQRVEFDSFVEAAGPLQREGTKALRLYRGNRQSPDTSPAALLIAVRAGAEFLLRHQRDNGSFEYRYQPKWDAYDDGENLLRQAGTTYAMLEVYRELGDPRYVVASRRALAWLLRKARPPRPEHEEARFLAIVSPGEEAKLGGAALAILAIVEHQRTTGDDRWIDEARKLARFLLHQQDESGHFRSKYFYGAADDELFESIYYPGEAVLALMRLHQVDPNPDWLTTAQRGADWLIKVRDAGKEVARLPHDHWLLMGLAELYQATSDSDYAVHAEKIARAIVRAQRRSGRYPDWIGSFYDPPRSTPTATRGEALVAMVRLCQQTGVDASPYLEALERMAQFQLRTQLNSENSIYLARSDRAVGGFRRSLENWEVRIDYVQHNVSALLGLRELRRQAQPNR